MQRIGGLEAMLETASIVNHENEQCLFDFEHFDKEAVAEDWFSETGKNATDDAIGDEPSLFGHISPPSAWHESACWE